jgi:L-rhamnose mutarotase
VAGDVPDAGGQLFLLSFSGGPVDRPLLGILLCAAPLVKRFIQEAAVPRVCFTMQVRADLLDEYRQRHAAVWPEMLGALRDAGWHDYQLFLRDDGLVVGTLVTDDLVAAQAAMEGTSINSFWQADMARYFQLPDGRPDRSAQPLDLIFDLDAQLRAVGDEPIAPIGDPQ